MLKVLISKKKKKKKKMVTYNLNVIYCTLSRENEASEIN